MSSTKLKYKKNDILHIPLLYSTSVNSCWHCSSSGSQQFPPGLCRNIPVIFQFFCSPIYPPYSHLPKTINWSSHPCKVKKSLNCSWWNARPTIVTTLTSLSSFSSYHSLTLLLTISLACSLFFKCHAFFFSTPLLILFYFYYEWWDL